MFYYNNISNKITKYEFRFKSLSEVEHEFGPLWRNGENDWNNNMDYLLGTDVIKHKVIYDNGCKGGGLYNNVEHIYHPNYINYEDNDDIHIIDDDMIVQNKKKNGGTLNYNEPRQLVYEGIKPIPYKYKYFIKTENELINEFGKNWNYDLGAHWNKPKMNYLYGTEIEYDIIKNQLDDNGELQIDMIKIPNNSNISSFHNEWYIDIRLIKKVISGINYNEPRKLVYESKKEIYYYNKITRKKTIYPYRFKTEDEFKKEYIRNWYNHTGWASDGEMDYLFGLDFNYSTDKEWIDNINKKHFFLSDYQSGYIDIGWDDWSVSKKMLVRNDDFRPTYNEPRQLVYEGIKPITYKYFIKTEDQIINEFGDNWDVNLDANWNSPPMDYLYGTEIEYDIIKNQLDDNGNIRRYCVYVPRLTGTNRWSINKNLIKKVNILPNYNEPRKLVYEGKQEKYDYYIKTEEELKKEYGSNWRNDNDICWCSPYMDYFWGTKIDFYYIKDNINFKGDINSDSGDISIPNDFNNGTYNDNRLWYLNKKVIKKVIKQPNYNEPRKLVYENKINKFNEIK